MKRACIFIDGANFYHRALKILGIKELDFDFEEFANFLANGRKLNKECKRFYTGTVPELKNDKRTRKAMIRQHETFSYLRKNGWRIKTSILRKRTEELKIDKRVVDYQKILKANIQKIKFERLREKGIDVKMATDLIVGSIDDKYDTAILVSSDMDLIPAIDWVRFRMNKRVEYIGFSVSDEEDKINSTTPILAMIAKTDSQRVLSDLDLKRFVK